MKFLTRVLAMCALVSSTAASAAVVQFSGSGTGPGGISVSALAKFDLNGDILTITLQNTSAANNGQDVPGSTLTGLFWKSVSGQALTAYSANLAAGSSILGNCTLGGSTAACGGAGNVGGEFGYQAAAGGFGGGSPTGANRGIASSGYLSTGMPGNIGNFATSAGDLDDPNSLDGINFGIVSKAAGFNANGGLEKVPVVQDTVIFVMKGATGMSLSDFQGVSFQYGTAFSELNIPSDPNFPQTGLVPEPRSLALLGAGLLVFMLSRRLVRSTAPVRLGVVAA